jgi:hypothetical protein
MLRAESIERLSVNAKKGDKQWATVTDKKGKRKNQSSRRNLLLLQFVLTTPDRKNKKRDISALCLTCFTPRNKAFGFARPYMSLSRFRVAMPNRLRAGY